MNFDHSIYRSRAVDLVKTIAICGVLLIHVSAGGLSGAAVGSAPWAACLFWNALSRSAVPLFLMASGALLLPPEKPLSLKKLYTRNLPRLLAALLFWGAVYALFRLARSGNLSAAALLQAGKELVLFKHEEHLYYLQIMLLVYAFLPMTRLIAAHAGERERTYLLALWFLLGVLYPTVRTFWPVTLLTGIPVQWRMNMTYASIGYGLLGFAMTKRPPRRSLCAAALAAGFLITFCGTWACSAAKGALDDHFLEGMSLGPFLAAVGIFGLCQRVSLTERAARMFAWLSSASFCVFLTHILFLRSLALAGFTVFRGPAGLTIPLLAGGVLACGCLAYALLSRIPVICRWLI